MGGYTGSTFDVNGTGDPGRVEEYGVGVVDVARGLGWLDAVGEAPGEEYRGEEWSDGARYGKLSIRLCPVPSSGAAEDSTSLSKDCRKLGPAPLAPVSVAWKLDKPAFALRDIGDSAAESLDASCKL
jgi:hypothetical protein